MTDKLGLFCAIMVPVWKSELCVSTRVLTPEVVLPVAASFTALRSQPGNASKVSAPALPMSSWRRDEEVMAVVKWLGFFMGVSVQGLLAG